MGGASSVRQIDDGNPLIHAAALSTEPVELAQSQVLPGCGVWALKTHIYELELLGRRLIINYNDDSFSQHVIFLKSASVSNETTDFLHATSSAVASISQPPASFACLQV